MDKSQPRVLQRRYLEEFREVDGTGHVVVDLAYHLEKLLLRGFLPHRFQHLRSDGQFKSHRDQAMGVLLHQHADFFGFVCSSRLHDRLAGYNLSPAPDITIVKSGPSSSFFSTLTDVPAHV